MANDFKRNTVASVTDSQTGASADAVYTVPAGAGSTALESIVIGINLCNKTASNITGSIFLDNFSGSNDVYIAKDLVIPAKTTVEIMQGNKIVLQNNGTTGDVIRVETNTATALDVTLSVLEDV
jgi:hypothetical protein